MPNAKVIATYKKLTEAADYEIGDASDVGLVTTHVVTLVPTGSPGNITIKARPQGRTAEDNGVANLQIPYIKRHINGTVADDSVVSAAISGSAGDSIIEIPSTGLNPVLSVASADGSNYWEVYIARVEGTV